MEVGFTMQLIGANVAMQLVEIVRDHLHQIVNNVGI
jgi:hypothetical protein